MAEAMLKRSQVPVEETWDLTPLYKNDEACKEALEGLEALAKDMTESYKGKIQESQDLAFLEGALRRMEQFTVDAHRVMTYAYLRVNTDLADPVAQKLSQELGARFSKVMAALSFFTDELSKLAPEVLDKAIAAMPDLAVMLGDIRRAQPHQLSPESETLLALLAPILSLPDQVYDTIKGADMRFPEVQTTDKAYPLSYVLYENEYAGVTDTQLRRNAFKTFSEHLTRYRNTTAAIYNAQVQKEKILATARGYDSVFDYLLFNQKVDESLYNRQIDLIMSELAPHMRRWAKLLQKAYGLEEMRYSDLKLALDPDFSPKLSIEDCKRYVHEALAVMGKDYQAMIMRAFDERWVDFAQNQGKSTGGFCTVPPKAQPYILLSWNNDLSELYTLLHELGHAAQGILCEQSNSPLQSDFVMYDVEAPSTFHEMLLTRSLLKEGADKRLERYVLASMVGNTYYHNFVTHLLEAAYQREVYRLVDQGVQLGADDFDRLFKEVLEKFWGDAVVLDEGAELTWMRQPHYYNGLYSYTYSAALVISTEFAARLAKEGEAIVPEWIKYLSTGGPMAPVEHAKLAGIDISSDAPLRRTIAYIGSLITQIEALS